MPHKQDYLTNVMWLLFNNLIYKELFMLHIRKILSIMFSPNENSSKNPKQNHWATTHSGIPKLICVFEQISWVNDSFMIHKDRHLFRFRFNQCFWINPLTEYLYDSLEDSQLFSSWLNQFFNESVEWMIQWLTQKDLLCLWINQLIE